jgi:hypothetical protein
MAEVRFSPANGIIPLMLRGGVRFFLFPLSSRGEKGMGEMGEMGAMGEKEERERERGKRGGRTDASAQHQLSP